MSKRIYKLSKEHREKISLGVKKNLPKTIFKKGHKINLGRKRKPISLEHKKILSEKMKGKNNPFYGKHHSKEIRLKMSKNRRGKLVGESHFMKKKEISEKVRISRLNTIKKRGYLHTENSIEKIRKQRAKQIFPIKDTSIEVKIQNFLKKLGIEFFTHQYMKIPHGYQCDILIPSMNLVIECDGDYWHKYPIGRDIDNVRTKELIEKGFKVLRLWEFEIKKMELKDMKNRIYVGGG